MHPKFLFTFVQKVSCDSLDNVIHTSRNKAFSLVSCAFCFPILLAQTTFAQNSSEEDIEVGDDIYELQTFVVEGSYKASLLDAQAIKRETVSIVDTLTTADLGDYTDQNLAESLQRIAGVQISRSQGGEGQFVSIRGLGPQFNITSINGRGVRGGSGGDGGLANRSAYGLDNVAPEMVSGVTVFKSPTANLDEGGIGGVINIETPRPLDAQKQGRTFSFSGSADGSYYIEPDAIDPRLSGLAIWTPSENFGILASVAYNDRTTLTQVARLIQTDSNDTVGGVPNVLRPGANSQYQVNDGSIEKLGIGITAQWKPSEDVNIILDYLTNENDTIRQQNNMRHRTTGNGSTILDPMVIETPEFPRIGGILDFAVFSEGFNGIRGNGGSIQGVGTLTTFLRNDDVYGARIEWNPNQGAFTYSLDVSHSESEFDRDNRILTFNFNDVPDGFYWDRNVSGMPFMEFLPNSVTGERYNPGDASPTLGNLGFNVINLGNEEDIFALDVVWEADRGGDGFKFSKVYAGYKYRERSADTVFNVFRFNAGTRRNTILPDSGLTESDVPAFTTYKRDFPSPDGGFLSEIERLQTREWFSPSNEGVYDFWMPLINNSSLVPDLPGGFMARDPNAGGNGQNRYEQADEEVDAFYLMTDFEGTMGETRFRGNIGVRYHDTAVFSSGFRSRPETVGDTVSGPEGFVYDSNGDVVNIQSTLERDQGGYSDWLPSATITFDLSDEFVLRLAASSVISRPNLSAIAGSSSVSPSFEFGEANVVDGVNITGRDVNLAPFEADQKEAIIEWYPSTVGTFLALGYFEKDIKSFNFTESFSPSSWTIGGVTYVDSDAFDVQVSAPTNNSDGAKVTGAEFQVHVPFNQFLKGKLGNFGIQGSFTKLFDNETSLLDPITGANLPLNGASEDNYSIVAYSVAEKFSWRSSYTYRGRNLTSPNTQGGALFAEAYRSWDMNFTYRLNKNVSLRLQALNLLEQARKQTFANGLFPYSYSQNGRSIIGGARFKF